MNPKPKDAPTLVNAAVYVRGHDCAPAVDVEAARALAALRGWSVSGVFEDVSASRARRARRAFAKLMGLVNAGRVQAVIVSRLSDIFCSPREALEVLATLGGAGVTLVSTDGAFDSSRIDTASKFAGLVLEAVLGASLEGRVIAVGAAIERGRWVGRPKVRVDAEVVRHLLAKGWPLRRLAREVRIGYGTLQRFQAGIRVDVPR